MRTSRSQDTSQESETRQKCEGWYTRTEKQPNGWWCVIIEDGKGLEVNRGAPRMMEHDAIDEAEVWCRAHPRYECRVSVHGDGFGYQAVVVSHEGDELVELGPYPTEEQTQRVGRTWIEAKLRQEQQILAMSEELKAGLLGDLSDRYDEIDALEGKILMLKSQVSKLTKQRDAKQAEARDLVRRANDPQIPLDFTAPLCARPQEADASEEEDTQLKIDKMEADDDVPLADANGLYPDGPRLAQKKGRKSRSARGAGRAGRDPAKDRSAYDRQ